jgi:hypothetical protein
MVSGLQEMNAKVIIEQTTAIPLIEDTLFIYHLVNSTSPFASTVPAVPHVIS